MQKLTVFFILCLICSFAVAENPIIKHIYTADAAAHVFNGRVYVYTTHDTNDANYFDTVDWHVFSSDNLENWTDHGAIFSLDDISWANKWAWAPDCAERDGKYYFYYPVERTKMGVAVSDKPTGPFKDAIGKPLIDNAIEPFAGPEPIDPAVFIDDDGQAYLYFGCRELRIVKLKENMIERKGDLHEVKIIDKEGTTLKWKDNPEIKENIQKKFGGDGVFGEAPWVFKYKGKYYMLYSNGWASDSTLIYGISDDPMGPFTYMGKVMTPVDCWTSHGSIIKFREYWYIFYHTMELSKNNYRRCICVDRLVFNEDGTIKITTPTKQGVSLK
ncbi:MAG: family 43 glycosylhydrolase [Sedimentisphaerales bacterium]|nr:family 43 glycosylhydrolase [Sedimentisphaerales bacterium]